MGENLRQTITSNVLYLLLLIIGVILLTDPLFGYSRMFPDGVFHLVFGFLLLSSGVFLYWSETNS